MARAHLTQWARVRAGGLGDLATSQRVAVQRRNHRPPQRSASRDRQHRRARHTQSSVVERSRRAVDAQVIAQSLEKSRIRCQRPLRGGPSDSNCARLDRRRSPLCVARASAIGALARWAESRGPEAPGVQCTARPERIRTRHLPGREVVAVNQHSPVSEWVHGDCSPGAAMRIVAIGDCGRRRSSPRSQLFQPCDFFHQPTVETVRGL
jgi:hypothetical protein